MKVGCKMFVDKFGIFSAEEYKKLKLAVMVHRISKADVELLAYFRIMEIYNALLRHLMLHCKYDPFHKFFVKDAVVSARKLVERAYSTWNVENIFTYLIANGYIGTDCGCVEKVENGIMTKVACGFVFWRDLLEMSDVQMGRVRELQADYLNEK